MHSQNCTGAFSLGIDNLCVSVQSYVETVCEGRLNRNIFSEGEVSEDIKQKIINTCKPSDLFDGLKTRYAREKYYENYFQLSGKGA